MQRICRAICATFAVLLELCSVIVVVATNDTKLLTTITVKYDLEIWDNPCDTHGRPSVRYLEQQPLECISNWAPEQWSRNRPDVNPAITMKQKTGWMFTGQLDTSDEPKLSRQIVVVGLENSGTSAIAAALRMLGVHMGSEAMLDYTHEDNTLVELASQCPTSGDQIVPPEVPLQMRRSLDFEIKRRNKLHTVWGFKAVGLLDSVAWETLMSHLPHARLILALREPTAIAIRQLPNPGDVDAAVRKIRELAQLTENNIAMAAKLTRSGNPLFIVSHDLLVKRPNIFLSQIEDFVGMRYPNKDVVLEMLSTPGYKSFCPRSQCSANDKG